MRTPKKTIKATHATGKCIKRELYRFLLDFRTTPHSTTGVAPATAFFGRVVKNKLPHIPTSHSDDTEMRARDGAQKEKMRKHADNKLYVRPNNFKVGDHVVVKDISLKKSTTAYQPEPLVVTGTKGSMITAKRGAQELVRNSSFFKTVQASIPPYAEEPEDVQPTEPGLLPELATDPSPGPHALVPATPPGPAADLPTPGPPVRLPPADLPAGPPAPLGPAARRPQRTSRKPSHLKDYILN